jgi:hypothetical protein
MGCKKIDQYLEMHGWCSSLQLYISRRSIDRDLLFVKFDKFAFLLAKGKWAPNHQSRASLLLLLVLHAAVVNAAPACFVRNCVACRSRNSYICTTCRTGYSPTSSFNCNSCARGYEQALDAPSFTCNKCSLTRGRGAERGGGHSARW